jgi:Spy/CpxP family protein refolding chaperone
MKRNLSVLLTFLVLAAGPAAAETRSPYAGFERRDLKALSPEEIDDLQTGRGMGMALVAELNGYPGPRHLLDLQQHLALSPAQLGVLEQLFAEMQAEARRLGRQIVAEEAALERMFRDGLASDADLSDGLASLGRLRGELRYTHLRSHIAAKDLLTPQQIKRYNTLRGYDSGAGHGADGASHH